MLPPKNYDLLSNSLIQMDGVSDRHPLDLIERDLVAGAVVELGGPWAFVGGHGLGVFEGAARFEIGGDLGRPEGVTADREGDAGIQGASIIYSQISYEKIAVISSRVILATTRTLNFAFIIGHLL